jgi:hypothetical protein
MPGQDPTLPSSYRPISLLETVGKLCEWSFSLKSPQRSNRARAAAAESHWTVFTQLWLFDETAARRPAPGPLSGAASAPLPAPVEGKTFTGKQAANSDRQVGYAEVGAAYGGVLAGRQVKGAIAAVDSSAPLSSKDERKRLVCCENVPQRSPPPPPK